MFQAVRTLRLALHLAVVATPPGHCHGAAADPASLTGAAGRETGLLGVTQLVLEP